MALEPITCKAMRICALLLIVSTGVAAPLAAQSLADVSRKESERRQAVKEPGKSYSNKDLKSAPAPAPPDASSVPADQKDDSKADSPADASSSADSGGAAKDARAAKDKEPVRDQAYWSKRMTDLHEQLSRDQVYMDALQSRINALTTDYVNRDNPIERNQIAADRQRALDELARLKKGTEEDKKAIADLEEEARRAAVPPGWLR
jgi:chromosome segregation ATPase